MVYLWEALTESTCAMEGMVAGAGQWLGWLVGASSGTEPDLPSFDPDSLKPYNGTDIADKLYVALDGASTTP